MRIDEQTKTVKTEFMRDLKNTFKQLFGTLRRKYSQSNYHLRNLQC